MSLQAYLPVRVDVEPDGTVSFAVVDPSGAPWMYVGQHPDVWDEEGGDDEEGEWIKDQTAQDAAEAWLKGLIKVAIGGHDAS